MLQRPPRSTRTDNTRSLHVALPIYLDALARKGTRFSAAYTPSPICVPARASIATGRYVHEHRCWDNAIAYDGRTPSWGHRSEEHTSELQSLMRISYAVFCLKKKNTQENTQKHTYARSIHHKK